MRPLRPLGVDKISLGPPKEPSRCDRLRELPSRSFEDERDEDQRLGIMRLEGDPISLWPLALARH